MEASKAAVSNGKPTIAIDIDEVLCKFIEPLTIFAAREFGAPQTVEDFYRCLRSQR